MDKIKFSFPQKFSENQLIVAEKKTQKIAVEVKTFVKPSFTHEFHSVLGQYLSYLLALEETDKNRILYLAVPSNVWETEFQEKGFSSKSQIAFG